MYPLTLPLYFTHLIVRLHRPTHLYANILAEQPPRLLMSLKYFTLLYLTIKLSRPHYSLSHGQLLYLFTYRTYLSHIHFPVKVKR